MLISSLRLHWDVTYLHTLIHTYCRYVINHHPPSLPNPTPWAGCLPRQVVDEQIDQEKLVAQFRERLTSRLDELGLGKAGLAEVFEEIDVTRKGELTMAELSSVLFKLNFHTTKVTITATHSRARDTTLCGRVQLNANLLYMPQARQSLYHSLPKST